MLHEIDHIFGCLASLFEAQGDSSLSLRPIGSNENEVRMGGFTVLFSYATPVAFYEHASGKFYKTDEKFSSTTSKHITRWLGGAKAETMPQDDIVKHIGSGSLTLKPIGMNIAEVHVGQYRVLFSYAIPVAYYDSIEHKYYRSSKKFSVTTSRHVNAWLDGVTSTMVTQERIEKLLGNLALPVEPDPDEEARFKPPTETEELSDSGAEPSQDAPVKEGEGGSEVGGEPDADDQNLNGNEHVYYSGTLEIHLEAYDTDEDGKDVYRGKVETPDGTWEFDCLAARGEEIGVAGSALSFGSHQENGKDAPDWMADPAISSAIESGASNRPDEIEVGPVEGGYAEDQYMIFESPEAEKAFWDDYNGEDGDDEDGEEPIEPDAPADDAEADADKTTESLKRVLGLKESNDFGLPDNVEIVDAVDGSFMILVDGVQWGPPNSPRDRSGAASNTWGSEKEAAEAFLSSEESYEDAVTGDEIDSDNTEEQDIQTAMEDGYVMSDARGGGIGVSYNGKFWQEFSDRDEAEQAIKDNMEKDQYWPSVVWVSDHGNASIVVIGDDSGDYWDDVERAEKFNALMSLHKRAHPEDTVPPSVEPAKELSPEDEADPVELARWKEVVKKHKGKRYESRKKSPKNRRMDG